jgi:signal transduction protein with GAF and PtsI domain
VSDEMTLRRAMERGAKAKAILDDAFVKEAFAVIEGHIFSKFKDAPIRDEEGVLKAKQLFHAATLFRRVFEDAIRNGQAAENALEQKRKGISFLGDVWPSRRPRRP